MVLDWSQAGNSQNSSSQGSTSLNPPELQANQSFKTSFSDPAREFVSDRHSPAVELVTFRETKPVTELKYKTAEEVNRFDYYAEKQRIQ